MSTVLESLKERLDAAKARLLTAQQQHQATTVELQSATNEHNIWHNAVAIETREEEKRQAEQQKQQMVLPQVVPDSITITLTDDDHLSSASDTGNKTELVRDILRKHATGITPGGLWIEVRDKISSRPYLYSILKRLRDKEEVSIRRGKYVLRPKMADVKSEGEQMLVQ